MYRFSTYFGLLALLIAFVLIVFTTFYTLKFSPPIWPDEAIYADVALNFINGNQLVTYLWGSTVPGITDCACWYPPSYFLLTSVFLRLFGFSIEVHRLLSVVFYIGFITSLGLYLRVLFQEYEFPLGRTWWVWMFVMSTVSIDFWLLVASRLSRPEILILFLGMLAVYFSHRLGTADRRMLMFGYSTVSGLLLGVAFTAHIMSAVFIAPLFIYHAYLFLVRKYGYEPLLAFIGGVVTPLLGWFIYLGSDIYYAYIQYKLAVGRMQGIDSWFMFYFAYQNVLAYVHYWVYFIVSVFFLYFTAFVAQKKQILLTLLVLFGWLVPIFASQHWYAVYIVAFAYLCLGVMFYEAHYLKQRTYVRIATRLTIALLFLLNMFSNLMLIGQSKNYDYELFSAKVVEQIERDKVVLLSSIPDVYYGLKQRNQAKIYKFPDFAISEKQYLSLLDESDYIVYNGTYNPDIFPGFIEEYVAQHTHTTITVAEGGYSATIYKFER